MSQPTVYTIAQVNEYIKGIIDNDMLLKGIVVQGEISNVKHHSSGHIYLTIKDDKSELNAVMFRGQARLMKFNLKEGMHIIARGSVTVYAPKAQYSLVIENITLDGVGELYMRYEQLKQSLSERGWFDRSIKKVIPRFPKNIGVVTAPTGAAIRDIIITIRRRYPVSEIYLFPCLVQGKDAAKDVAKKIAEANVFFPKLDVMIVGRGGGSIEDLWCFNELEVVQAIYDCSIPIISAVGHEIDTTLSDLVADARAATPTAAAELATPNHEEMLLFLKEQFLRMIKLIKTKVDFLESQLKTYKANYHLTNLDWIYIEKQQSLDMFKQKMMSLQSMFLIGLENEISRQEGRIIQLASQRWQKAIQTHQQLAMRLDLLSPLKTLHRGYSVTYDQTGKSVKSVGQLTIGENLVNRISDGKVYSTIVKIEESQNE